MAGEVLCMRSEWLDLCGIREGFNDPGGDMALFLDGATEWVPRDEAETNEEYRQVIPYISIHVIWLDGGCRVFTYRRRGDGESRLRGFLSLGVGGHVERGDAVGAVGREAVRRAANRELDEEVRATRPLVGGRVRFLGVINDTSNPVGRVHVGIFGAVFAYPPVVPNHDDWDDCLLMYMKDLEARSAEFESWSRIVIDQYYIMKRNEPPPSA
jgi:predicted NUDIX family phosphoesterase